MSYWGSKPDESDFAFDAIGAYVFLIKDRMSKDTKRVLDNSYPEQAIVASLKCLRALAEEFPKCVSLHFRRKDLEESRAAFDRWFQTVKSALPAAYSDAIRAEATAEFLLFEERVLERNESR